MDYDDWTIIPPPRDKSKAAEMMGPSGEPVKDFLLITFNSESIDLGVLFRIADNVKKSPFYSLYFVFFRDNVRYSTG